MEQKAKQNEMQGRNVGDLNRRRLVFGDFHLLKFLGSGFSGKVFLCEYIPSGKKYALKIVSKSKTLRLTGGLSRLHSERNVMRMARRNNDPFLVKMFGSFQTEKHVFFVMEYVEAGDLDQYMLSGHLFPENLAVFYSACVVLGIEHLHKQNIVHRDIKLSNLLISADGYLKLCDFGLCKEGMDRKNRMDSRCGTAIYMAPEVVALKPYTRVVDWWSLGIVIYVLLTGRIPFSGNNVKEIHDAILGEEAEYPDSMSQEGISLIKLLLVKEPKKRLGASSTGIRDIKRHPFYKQINWDLLERKCLKPPILPTEATFKNMRTDKSGTKSVSSALLTSEDVNLTPGEQASFRDFSFSSNHC